MIDKMVSESDDPYTEALGIVGVALRSGAASGALSEDEAETLAAVRMAAREELVRRDPATARLLA